MPRLASSRSPAGLVALLALAGAPSLPAADGLAPHYPGDAGIAPHYPGDAGIARDPAVLFAANFESGDMKR